MKMIEIVVAMVGKVTDEVAQKKSTIRSKFVTFRG
jgi:hypothetical protein